MASVLTINGASVSTPIQYHIRADPKTANSAVSTPAFSRVRRRNRLPVFDALEKEDRIQKTGNRTDQKKRRQKRVVGMARKILHEEHKVHEGAASETGSVASGCHTKSRKHEFSLSFPNFVTSMRRLVKGIRMADFLISGTQ
jgi:hypothetical protein